MAGFRTHITVSGALGIAYGGFAVQPLEFTTGAGILAAAVTGIGGMLPDLDSDSGIPVREMFGLMAAVVPLMLVFPLHRAGVSTESILATLLVGYAFIRYFAANAFRRITVHRGMYHSIPAMLVAGLCVYLAYPTTGERGVRLLLGVGVMLGFLSHLVLDEMYSVDWRGLKPKLKSSAGSAVKFFSPSLPATATCYLILGALCYVAYRNYQKVGGLGF